MGLYLLPLVFSLILTVASRLLHPCHTSNEEKILHSEGHQRGSKSHIEKRRGRREIEMTRRRRGGIKRVETDLASVQFPKFSLQPGILKVVHRVG